jgi:hypothetical protein
LSVAVIDFVLVTAVTRIDALNSPPEFTHLKQKRKAILTRAAAIAVTVLPFGACATEPISAEAISPTAVCLDGTRSYGPRREGVCAGHDGVSRWMDNFRHGMRHD